MKNIFKLLFIVSGMFFISCSDDLTQEGREALAIKTAPVLISPNSTFSMVLNKDNANDVATTFVWDYAAYNGTSSVISYSIEFDQSGTNFASPTVVSTSFDKFKELKVSELNQGALDAGFAPFVASTIDVRIKATVGTTGTALPQYSNHFTITLTPYPSWPNWGIIGSATPTGWSSDTNLNYNLTTKIYSISMLLTGGGEFKFRLDDSWSMNYGDDGNNLTLDQNGANIPVPVTGTYLVKANFGNTESDGIPPLSYTITLQ